MAFYKNESKIIVSHLPPFLLYPLCQKLFPLLFFFTLLAQKLSISPPSLSYFPLLLQIGFFSTKRLKKGPNIDPKIVLAWHYRI